MSTDSLTQPQREALISILVLGMYSDGLLSLAEDESLNKFLDSIQWESGTGRTVFLTDAITEVTSINNDVDLADYIERNASAFDTAEARKSALDALTGFLKVDGIAEAEAPLLAKISEAFEG
ncbi:MAG: hypothetical protein ACREKL_06990 [Chthoniobacterales bacterium]